MKQLRTIYAIRPIRLAFKLSVCLFGVKVCGDLFYWCVAGIPITFPRFTQTEQCSQHPLNPPIPLPYPVQRQAAHLHGIHTLDTYHQKIAQTLYSRQYFVHKLYTNKPMRENPNEIDHFMLYSESSRLWDAVYAKVLRKMRDNGVEIPEGINQKIRGLSQWQFDGCGARVLPHL